MKKRIVKTMLAAILPAAILSSISHAHAATPAQQAGGSKAILLQGFHWNSAGYTRPDWYNTLTDHVDDVAALGITHVWFPPPSDSAAREGYLPRQLNSLTSGYGSSAELTGVVSAFKSRGIQSIADIVVNHRVGTAGWADFTNPTWSTKAVVSGDECNCGLGNGDTGDGFSAGRDLDHTNVAETQNGIVGWLNSTIKPAGFTGLRFDYVKGFNATYAGKYANAFAPDFCVGELWGDFNPNDMNAHRQAIMNWIDGTGSSCGAFDFTTKAILNDALANGNYWRLKDSAGKPQGAIGWWPAMSVTFVDNHDTGPAEACGTGQNHWPVPCGSVLEGYAYILSHPGIPTVFYPHVYDWNLRAQIAALINARKAAGVHSTSSVAIVQASQGLYAAIVTGTTRQLAMKIGPNSWSPGSGWVLQASGTNYAVWMK